MRRNRVSSDRTNLFGELDLPFLKQFDLAKFTLSNDVIPKAKDNIRDRKEVELRKVINKFNEMISHQQLPADLSLSRVIAVLRKLGKIAQALELFTLLNEKTNTKYKDKIIGAYTLTAILEIYRNQIKTKDSDETKAIVSKAEQLWELCKAKNYIDGYILTDMMCIYASIDQHKQALDLFSTYRKFVDLPMYSQYILDLIKTNNLKLAHQELESMKEQYKNAKTKNPQDEDAMYCVYNTFIIKYFDNLQNTAQALQIFEDAIKFGMYQNNQLQIKDNKVQLDFHLSKNYKEKEGGLPLVVAKVAFLYFMREVTQQEIHISAEIVTGGHIEQQSKIKKEFPDYLYKEYGIEIKWHDNPRVLAFTIPYTEIRKIRFINDIFSYLDSQKEHFGNEHTFKELQRHYRADLRRDNERRINKYFSEKPTIPKEFEEKMLSLANAAMTSYEKRKYGQAKNHYGELIKLIPNNPWPHTQLGWVLHRTGHYDAAITEYQTAIDFMQKNTDGNQSELLSETYRKMGWAYDRKYSNSKPGPDIENNLQIAFTYYQKALDANSKNIEVYNNWGQGLARLKNFKEAIKKFKIVKDKNPQHDEACVHLGNCYKRYADFEQAKEYYQQAITRSEVYDERKKSAAWAYCELGDLYSRQFKNDLSNQSFFELARNAFENSAKLQPTRDQAYYGLGDLYKLKGDTQKSNKYFDKARQWMPAENISSFAKIAQQIDSSPLTHEIQSKEEEGPEKTFDLQITPQNNFAEDITNHVHPSTNNGLKH